MNHPHQHNNTDLLKIAPYYSVLTAVIISGIKLYSWTITDSVSILAALTDSLLDITASVINLFAIHLALAPPDHNHRFGHNKIEDLAVFGQSVFFVLSGLFALVVSIKRILYPSPIENSDVGIYSMVASSIITVFLLVYQSYVIKKTSSSVIKADKLHYTTDLLTNILVIASLYMTEKFKMLDGLIGIGIACYIIYASYGLFINAMKNLVDEEWNDDQRHKIIAIIGRNKEILGVHDLKTRYAGSKPFVQMHLEMDGNMRLFATHKLSDKIMEQIIEEFPGAEVIIHQDPAGIEEDAPYREKL